MMGPSAQNPGELAAAEAASVRRRARARLQAALKLRGDPQRLRVIQLPAPRAPVTALMRASGPLRALFKEGLHCVLWHPAEDSPWCGIGAAWETLLSGEDRLTQLRTEAAQLFARLIVDPACESPRIFGGLAFAPGWRAARSEADPYNRFGDGRFFLPRWCYAERGGHPFLQHTLCADGARGPEALDELEAIFDALESADAERRDRRNPVEAVHQVAAAPWAAQVTAILRTISSGAAEKIVAARACTVTTSTTIDDGAIVSRLLEQQPWCTIFALRCGPATFAGATPERLIERRGATVRTEALAGTRGRGDGHDWVPGDEKDRMEHLLVVRDIFARLRPHCLTLPPPPPATSRALRDVVHLRTPISGRLREPPAHVLDLVGALHPTPAVAGAPAAAATRWIVEQEPIPRGWYAGPVGWFDCAGDGDFVVALRSGLMEGRSALIHAGAGIVPGSDPDREYEETALKQRALLSALGARP